MVFSWAPPTRPSLPGPSRCPSTSKSSCADTHTLRQADRQRARIHIPLPHPPLPGRQWVRFSCCVLGAQMPPLLPEGPGHLLPAPSQPLSQGFPCPRGAPAPPSFGLARLAPPAKRPCARIPVRCSPPRPLQSVHSYPQPQSIRLTSAPASRLLPPLPPLLQQPQPGRERVSERAREGGGGSSLRSAHPLLSGRSALPLLSVPSPALGSAAARAAPAPPGPPKGATRARPVLPRQPAGGPLAPAPCSFPRAPPGGIPFPSPGPLPPTVTGVPGRGRGLGETERDQRRGRSRVRGNTGWTHPSERRGAGR